MTAQGFFPLMHKISCNVQGPNPFRWYKIVIPWLFTCKGDNPRAKASQNRSVYYLSLEPNSVSYVCYIVQGILLTPDVFLTSHNDTKYCHFNTSKKTFSI